jgi:hypothetical protein
MSCCRTWDSAIPARSLPSTPPELFINKRFALGSGQKYILKNVFASIRHLNSNLAEIQAFQIVNILTFLKEYQLGTVCLVINM